jgi:hypothetical protein
LRATVKEFTVTLKGRERQPDLMLMVDRSRLSAAQTLDYIIDRGAAAYILQGCPDFLARTAQSAGR